MFNFASDNDASYREHIERLKLEQMMEMDRQRMKFSTQNPMYGAVLGSQKAYNQTIKPLPRFDPNKSEAFQIPLSQAVTMWQVKFGDKWYDAHQPRPEEGKDFYADVFGRIKQAELFENIDGWYRLKENVENLLANH